MKAIERGRNDWVIVLIVLVIGFLCVLAAGQLALRFAPDWRLNTNMDSHLDPNSDFLTQRPAGFIQSIDPAILTQPSWLNVFLTPGASFVTGTPFPVSTSTPFASADTTIIASVTNTVIVPTSPTNTLVYVPPTRTPVSNPVNTPTNTPSSQTTSTNTSTATATPIPTTTGTSTATPTVTATATVTPTFTFVPIPTDPIPVDIGTTPDGDPFELGAGNVLTLALVDPLIADGNTGDYDLVYYEFPAASGILMDWVIVEISDGNNWYTVFNWSDDNPDTNSNVNFNILSLPAVPPNPGVPPVEEIDQRDVLAADLYTSSSGFSTGIAIDVDSIVPAGTYPYIRFTAPSGDVDGQMEIDAIEVLP